MSDTLAVTIGATRADGSVEQVRIGTATRSGDGFQVTFFPMTIGGQVGAVSAAPVASAARSGMRASGDAGGGGDGMVFPPYGRSKGQPIRGASAQDLDFYANGCRRTLNDPGKARWHDKERALLAAIEAEQARQRGGGDSGGDYGGGSSGGFGFGGEPPPPGDEDAPF